MWDVGLGSMSIILVNFWMCLSFIVGFFNIPEISQLWTISRGRSPQPAEESVHQIKHSTALACHQQKLTSVLENMWWHHPLPFTGTLPQKLAAALTSDTYSHLSLSILRLFPLRVESHTGISSKETQTHWQWRDVPWRATHTCFCHLFVFFRRTQRLLFLVRHGVFWPLRTCHSRLFQPVHSADEMERCLFLSGCANFPTEWTNVWLSRIQTLNCTVIVPREPIGSTCALDFKTTIGLPRLKEVIL